MSIDEAIKNAVISNKTYRPIYYGISAFIPYYYGFLSDTKNAFIKAYELLYADMLPNSVQFAKHLVDLAAPVLQGQTTITEANIKAERRNMQHSKICNGSNF